MEDSDERIFTDPGILGGKPVIKGTRIPVYLIIELLESGVSEEKVLWEYPSLKKKDIKAALLFADKYMKKPT